MKQYRFFYHYRRSDKKMSVHFRGSCYSTENVDCKVPCQTKRNKIQPYLVLQGYCTELEQKDNIIIIK